MRLRRLTTRARQRASGASAAEARRRAAYPPTTWRTITRLQSIKCVRLLWLMHYEAIKNGNYSAVLSAARAHSREPDHIPCRTSTNAAARCNARSIMLVDTPTTRAPLQNASQTRHTRDVQSWRSVRFTRCSTHCPKYTSNIHFILVRKSVAFRKNELWTFRYFCLDFNRRLAFIKVHCSLKLFNRFDSF